MTPVKIPEKLKYENCPFCGGRELEATFSDYDRCLNIFCKCGIKVTVTDSSKWNTRPEPPAPEKKNHYNIQNKTELISGMYFAIARTNEVMKAYMVSPQLQDSNLRGALMDLAIIMDQWQESYPGEREYALQQYFKSLEAIKKQKGESK